ncbi:hypothetical protein ACET3X_001528 [Alternaria dauci]|uniref:C2H2-type domain-containing protein n=1 Tax=Alternaria dauci TaxID=48095 RepID=A0ABR3V091_9PLEO
MSTPIHRSYYPWPASVNRFSVALRPAPWSQVNTRLEYDESVEDRARELPQDTYAHGSYGDSVVLQPKERSDGYLLLCDAKPDPHTSLLHAPPTLSPAVTSSSADVVRCAQCHVAFTGVYAKGNLGRHLRHKHALVEEVIYRCTVPGCDKTFARKDAMLKHARKHHPGLHSGPVKRKQGNEAVATSSPRKVSGGSAPRRRSFSRSSRINRGLGSQTAGAHARIAHATKPIYPRGQDLQQSGEFNQTFADHNGLLAAITDQETCSSLQYFQPPRAEYTYGQTSAQTAITGYHSSTGMSTQPSSQGFGASPSLYSNPMPTGSTIVHDLEDSIIYSLLTPPCYNHDRTLQSGISPYMEPHDTLLSQEPLSEDYFQTISGCDASLDVSHVDPMLYQQSYEWPNSLDEDLE